MNRTVGYYDQHAAEYYSNTIDADFGQLRRKFASYMPEGARIIDIGSGSGRDVRAFCDMGFRAMGLDASEEMAREARDRLGIEVITGDMSEWTAEEAFDGIWCCAALLHLHEDEADRFFQNLDLNLKPGGLIFLSVKEGIETGYDDKGRYMRNYTEDELLTKLKAAGLEVLEADHTGDSLGRTEFRWLNVFAKKISE